MPFFLVKRTVGSFPAQQVNGKDAQLVYADTAADAILIAKTAVSYDNDASWVNATVVEITPRTDLSGVEVHATCQDASNVNHFYSFTGAANAVLADLVAGLTALMNADAATFPSGVTSSGLVITIAAGNSLGAKAHSCGFYVSAPAGVPATPGVPAPSTSVTGLPVLATGVTVSSVTTAGSARTFTFATPNKEGIRLRVTIADPTAPMDVSVYFGTDETIDALGARLVALINALSGSIATHVTYTASTQLITIPGATDAQGAKVITAALTYQGAAPYGWAPVVNAAGVSSIDRTITLPADTALPLPRVPAVVASVNVDGVHF